jgi:hypothetical protein
MDEDMGRPLSVTAVQWSKGNCETGLRKAIEKRHVRVFAEVANGSHKARISAGAVHHTSVRKEMRSGKTPISIQAGRRGIPGSPYYRFTKMHTRRVLVPKWEKALVLQFRLKGLCQEDNCHNRGVVPG